MGQRRTIAVVTGSRAEFGILASVMRGIAARRELRLRVIVAGAHLVSGTWKDVTAAGFEIDARVPMQKKGATGRAADVAAVGRGVIGFGAALTKIKPDTVVVLGDRIEAFAAATAGSIGGFIVGHIHGGDRAEGVADEAMRHAISKLAHVHFAATAESGARLVKMGEDKKSVHVVGSPAVDALRGVTAAGDAPDVIVLQHPVGGSAAEERAWMRGTLTATRHLSRLVMAPNGDPGSEGIRAAMKEAGVEPVEHLPRERWLSMLAGTMAIVGNSSAGLIEAAALRRPCVNVGPRQGGRERPGNVVDCDYGAEAVSEALAKAMAMETAKLRHPYGDGRSGEKIAAILARMDWERVSVRKRNAY